MNDIAIRRARVGDVDPVISFTADTWNGRDEDYMHRAFPEWVRSADGSSGTFVATVRPEVLSERTSGEVDPDVIVDGDGTGAAADGGPEAVVGCVQCVLLSPWEAWGQGIRVSHDARGMGVGTRLTESILAWARSAGASVCRNMVFSWNVAGLGQSRTAGFEPVTEFRFVHPAPRSVDVDAGIDRNPSPAVEQQAANGRSSGRLENPDPNDVWAFWQGSDARAHLRGLALDPSQPWACSALTRGRVADAVGSRRVIAVADGALSGFAIRTRTAEVEPAMGDGPETTVDVTRTAVYGVAAWRDASAAGSLFEAIAHDAGDQDADDVRVLIPETAAHVSDVAANRVSVDSEPDFVLSADLTDRRSG